jgi:hypothetical protein
VGEDEHKAKGATEQGTKEEGEKEAATIHEEEERTLVPEEDVFPFDPGLLKDAPPEVRRAFQMSFAMMRGGPTPSPLPAAIAEAINSDHLDHILTSIDEDAKLGYDAARHTRWINLICLAAILIFAGFVVWLLKDSNPELLKDLIAIVATLVGGAGIGFGVKTWREQRG